MKFTKFIDKLKSNIRIQANGKLSMRADGVILSEGDAFEMLENNDLQVSESDLIVDSDYLLSSNIAVAEKYKALQEFTEKNSIKHLKMTESGTLCNAVLCLSLLSKEKIYSSASCKIVAPYFEEGYTVLPLNSRNIEADNHTEILIVKVPLNLAETLEPEFLAFNAFEQINRLEAKQHKTGIRFILLESPVYNALGKSKRVRFFSIMNSFNLLGFEVSNIKAAKEICAEVFATLDVKEIMIDEIENLCTRYENIVPDETVEIETSGKFDRVFLGGCASGDFQTLTEIADFIEDKILRKNIEVIVTPANFEVYRQAAKSGILAKLSKTGFTIVFPSCASCKGNHSGIIASGENILSTFPLAEVGRMGHIDAHVFRCSTKSILKKIMQ